MLCKDLEHQMFPFQTYFFLPVIIRNRMTELTCIQKTHSARATHFPQIVKVEHTHTEKSKEAMSYFIQRKKISVFNIHLQVYFYQCKRKYSNSTFCCLLLFIQLLHHNSQTLQRCYFGYLILSYTHLSLMDICLADMMSESSSPSSVLKSVSCSSSLLLSSERCPADSVYVCGARELLCKKDEPCDTAAAARTVAVCTGRSVKHQHRKGLEQPQWYNQ